MSNRTLQVGQLSAAPGEKRYGVVEFAVQGRPYELPMWLIHGDQGVDQGVNHGVDLGDEAGPTLVVTGGVHASEYASIAAALELGQSLNPKGLRGRVIVVPVVNMPGFAARSIYVCPLDCKNPNRVFPGDANGTATEQLADWVFRNVIAQADFYVDMHGGDLVEELIPFTIFFRSGDDQVDAASLEIAKIFGIPCLVASESTGSTISAAARAGIPAILTESGAQGIWTAAQVADHTNGLQRLMRHLKMIEGPTPEPVPVTLFEKFHWLRSEHEGFWYPQAAAGHTVSAGQLLGCIKDWEGNVLQTAHSPAAGPVLFIVSSLAIHAGDPLFAIGA